MNHHSKKRTGYNIGRILDIFCTCVQKDQADRTCARRDV